jgi:hypothetical protein
LTGIVVVNVSRGACALVQSWSGLGASGPTATRSWGEEALSALVIVLDRSGVADVENMDAALVHGSGTSYYESLCGSGSALGLRTSSVITTETRSEAINNYIANVYSGGSSASNNPNAIHVSSVRN